MAQPTLVAKGEVVWPPGDFVVAVTHGAAVAGSFSAPAGAQHIEVECFVGPRARSYRTGRALSSAEVLATGFLDHMPPIGTPATYAAYTVVELVNGVLRVSEGVAATVQVTPEPLLVTVEVTPSQREGAYDISWTPPSFGTVGSYLTPDKPDAGLSNKACRVSGSSGRGLPRAAR